MQLSILPGSTKKKIERAPVWPNYECSSFLQFSTKFLTFSNSSGDTSPSPLKSNIWNAILNILGGTWQEKIWEKVFIGSQFFSHIHHLICKSMIDKYQVDLCANTFKGNRGFVWKNRENWKLKSKYLICKWVFCLPLTSRLLTIIKHHGCKSD